MPVINDATVAGSGREVSGNGGRKIAYTSNENILVVTKDTTKYEMYISKNKGNSFSLASTNTSSSTTPDIAIVSSKKGFSYTINTYNTTGIEFIIYDNDGKPTLTSGFIDSGQTALGNVSLAINEAGTKLYAAWASKNSVLANSMNIRFCEGTISTDGSVVWGVVEQRTMDNNSSTDNIEPTVISHDGKVTIVFRRQLLINSLTFNGTWGTTVKIADIGYPQSSPSARFVPQKINGLTNGLMAVAWHGTDSTGTTTNYIRFSKATDGTGATWSAMKKLVPGTNATLTVNKLGKLFITYEDAGVTKRIESTDNGDNWSTAITVGTGTNPSSLFDLTMNMSAPLTIRKGTSSVLFTGSWTTTTNSIPSGDIGQKTSKDNLLTYAVTTDGTMSTITEKVNGVTVGTKTATSGQSLTVSLTQAQWDAVRYGKYANTTGGRNTLTIEMGTEVWTYTFDKIPPVDAQITELLKSHIDSADVAIPAKKAMLGASIRGKGGTVNDTDSLEVMASAIGGIQLGKKKVTGTITSSSSAGTVIDSNGASASNIYVAFNMANLPFIPSVIEFIRTDKASLSPSAVWHKNNHYINGSNYANSFSGSNGFRVPYTNAVVNIPVAGSGMSIEWTAYEE